MNDWKNLVRRKFDYTANLCNYQVKLTRDFELLLDYNFVTPKVLKKTFDETYPDFKHTNIICSIIHETCYEFDNLNSKLTKFINKIN